MTDCNTLLVNNIYSQYICLPTIRAAVILNAVHSLRYNILYYTIISVYEGARGLCTLENGLYYSTVPIERGGTAYYILIILYDYLYILFIFFIIFTVCLASVKTEAVNILFRASGPRSDPKYYNIGNINACRVV